MFPRSGLPQSQEDMNNRGERERKRERGITGSVPLLFPILELYLVVEFSTTRNEYVHSLSVLISFVNCPELLLGRVAYAYYK